ncbi:hypothetical protein [Chondromyces crocatus]|uniref:Uncharacterized protein n=1 Tax=Chondromyces crocatus TaxID=52 RepID=A0A0K1EHJ0_CHOCO|nr:hypothetical protein [Chondromyces crocatus]AKT40137.1 uncharacterized protein CMC5_042900 [Chondromyces crocatus]
MRPEPAVFTNAVRRRRSPLLLTTSVLLFATALLCLALGLLTRQANPLFASMILGALFALSLRLPRSEITGTATVDARWLRFEDERLVELTEIQIALMNPRPEGPPHVRLYRRGFRPVVELQLPSEAEGTRLIEALGHHASQSVAVMRLPFRHLAHPRGIFFWVAFVLAVFWLEPPRYLGMPTTLFVILVALVVQAAIHTTLHVGLDGLLLTSLGIRRLIPIGDLAAISSYESMLQKNPERGLDLLLTSGEKVRIPIEGNLLWSSYTVEIVERRILDAMEAHRARASSDDLRGLLDRLAPTGKSTQTWLTSLRALGSGASAGLREPAVPQDLLWQVLETPSRPATLRAAATVALSAVEGVERSRLRIAARSVAEPRLRSAIEAAADARESDLEAALDALATDEDARGRARPRAARPPW